MHVQNTLFGVIGSRREAKHGNEGGSNDNDVNTDIAAFFDDDDGLGDDGSCSLSNQSYLSVCSTSSNMYLQVSPSPSESCGAGANRTIECMHPPMKRAAANELVRRCGKQGCFLVRAYKVPQLQLQPERPVQAQSSEFILTLLHKGAVSHHHLAFNADTQGPAPNLCTINGTMQVDNMPTPERLVQHLMEPTDFWPLVLTVPVGPEPAHQDDGQPL